MQEMHFINISNLNNIKEKFVYNFGPYCRKMIFFCDFLKNCYSCVFIKKNLKNSKKIAKLFEIPTIVTYTLEYLQKNSQKSTTDY